MAVRGGTRAIVAGFSAVVATASGVVTNVVSDHPTASWWVALGVLATVGVISQGVLTVAEGKRREGTVGAAGSVHVRGNSGAPITTRVRGFAAESSTVGGASLGLGAVYVDGDTHGYISTNVTGPSKGW